MRNVKRALGIAMVLMLAVSVQGVFAGEEKSEKKETKAAEKRAKIDSVAKETIDLLLEKHPKASELYDMAYGYAVFSNYKFAFGISGGGGHGVAVNKKAGGRIYMKVGTGGIGVGLGGQKYQLVILFQNQSLFEGFIDNAWKADGTAQAVAGAAGANAATEFTNGIAIYQFTEGGLMASADISGTRYWKSDKLN